MALNRPLAISVTLAGAFGLASLANASPVTYEFTSGTVQLSATATVGTTVTPLVLNGGSNAILNLTGTQVTFDPTAGTLNSFNFDDTGPAQSFSVSGLAALGTGEMITLSQVHVANASTGYSTSAWSGSNPYTFTAGPVSAMGMYALSGGNITKGTTSFNATNAALNGTITTVQDELQLMGVTIGTFNAAGATFAVKGDFTFFGAAPVPLPAAVWLFGSGLALLGFPLTRRSRAAAVQPGRTDG